MVDKTDNSAGDTQISGLYAELNRHEPLSLPASLDAAILAEAHRAVGAKPKSLRSPVYRWAPPLALAATVVLTATLVILVPENEHSPIGGINNVSSRDAVESKGVVRKKESSSQSAAAVAQAPRATEPLPTLTSKSRTNDKISVETGLNDLLAEEIAASRSLDQGLTGSNVDSLQSFTAMMEADVAEIEPPTREFTREQLTEAGADVVVATDAPVEQSKQRDPSEWRKEIEALIDKQKWQEAEKQFELFAQIYPDHEFVVAFSEQMKNRKEGDAEMQ